MPRYEFVEGTSSKFWEIIQSGSEVTTRWGRIGTAGQSKTKSFADEAAAAKQAEKLMVPAQKCLRLDKEKRLFPGPNHCG